MPYNAEDERWCPDGAARAQHAVELPRWRRSRAGGNLALEPDIFEEFLSDTAAVTVCDYQAHDVSLVAHITARAHQSSRRLTDELIETIARSEGAPRAEMDIAKSLLDVPIRYSRSTRLYTSMPEWACAMIVARVPAVVVEQTNP